MVIPIKSINKGVLVYPRRWPFCRNRPILSKLFLKNGVVLKLFKKFHRIVYEVIEMKILKICTILLVGVGLLFPATLPQDVENALDKIMSTLASYQTFRMDFQINAQLAGIKATADGFVLYDDSGKFRIELAQIVYLVCDGKNIWFYSPLSKEYSRGEFAIEDMLKMLAPILSREESAPSFGLALSFFLKQIFTSDDFALQNAFIQEETLDDKKAITLTFVSKKGFQIKIWADDKDYALLGLELLAKVAEEVNLTASIKVLKVSLMPTIAPGAFTFVPPPGAKEKK